jgi:hypothetical protein
MRGDEDPNGWRFLRTRLSHRGHIYTARIRPEGAAGMAKLFGQIS